MRVSAGGRLIRLFPLSFERELRRLRLRSRAFEPELSMLRDLCDPQGLAIDVGAGSGLYTFELLRICRHVVCFEPNPELAGELQRLLANTSAAVESIALGSRSSTGVLRVPEFEGKEVSGWASVGKDFRHATWEGKRVSSVRGQTIEIRKLDDYAFEDVTFVKIDVEGFEQEVLCGAEDLIGRCRPSLVIEIEQRHHKGPIRPVIEWLTSRGYQAWFLSDGGLTSIDKFDAERDQSDPGGTNYVNNFIFIPVA